MDNIGVTYRVEKKSEGSYRTKRILVRCLIGLLYIFPIFVVGFMYNILGGKAVYLAIAIPVWIGFVFKALRHVIFCWVDISYEYQVQEKGIFTYSIIYGGRKPKLLLTSRVKEWTEIAPLTTEKMKELRNSGKTVYNALPSEVAVNEFAYYGLFKDEQGADSVVFLEAPDKTVKAFQFYNSANTKARIRAI